MNKEHILLSISMLISGRDEMEKSLNSLLFFKKAFPTEIILVDTGCNTEQRALAEKYADKIVDFVWCNDFAAARNAGLKEAQGEWFMYLDDDEWFDDPQEIIAFFKSGTYKKYNGASYEIRNYMDFQGRTYVTTYPSRMVKLQKNTRFVGKIHEFLAPYDEPIKRFTDFVHHYGYVFKSAEEKAEHACRNIKPLLEMRKENPGNTRWMIQLAQEYFAVEQYERTVDACQKGLKEWKQFKDKVAYNPIHIGALYSYILFSLEYLAHYQEEEEWLQKALKENLNEIKEMEICVVFYNLAAARLYRHLENNELCLEYFGKYLNGLKKFKNNRNLIDKETVVIVSNVFHNVYYSETVLMCLPILLHKKEYRLAQESFKRIDWKEREVFYKTEYAKKIIDTCCDLEFIPFFNEMIQKFVQDEDGIHEMYPVFRNLQTEYQKYGETKKTENLRWMVAGLNNEHFYVQASKIIWEWEEGQKDEERIKGYFHTIFIKCPDHIFEVEDQVWEIAKEISLSIESFLMQMDYRTWRRALESMEHWGSSEDWDKWNARVREWKSREDIRYDLFDIKYMGSNLAKITKKTESLSELENQLWTYADMVYEFYQPYYREDVLQENSIGLPDELQLALELRNLRGYRKSGQESKELETMKKCLGVYPKLDKTMLVYAKMLRDEMKRQTTEAAEAQKELQQMVIYMKNLAETRIEREELDAARAILSQIQQFAPDDEEIKRLLDQIKQ